MTTQTYTVLFPKERHTILSAVIESHTQGVDKALYIKGDVTDTDTNEEFYEVEVHDFREIVLRARDSSYLENNTSAFNFLVCTLAG